MRLVAAESGQLQARSKIETIFLSPAEMEFLEQLSRQLNPAMPFAFGGAHAVRSLLETLEEAEQQREAERR